MIKHMREISPEAKNSSCRTIGMPAYALKYGVQALHPAPYNIQFPGFIEECHKSGIAVNVWTVWYEYRDVMQSCDAIITNYPDKHLKTIRRLIWFMRRQRCNTCKHSEAQNLSGAMLPAIINIIRESEKDDHMVTTNKRAGEMTM